MENKPVFCPLCGKGTKLMEIKADTFIQGSPIEIKCRRRGHGRDEHIIQIFGNGQTKVIK